MPPQQNNVNEILEWSRPVGWYPPLYSKNKLDTTEQPTLFFLTLGNLLLRTLSYPLCFALSAFLTVLTICIATFLNIGFLLGGVFSSAWREATGRYNQTAMIRSLWLILDPIAFIANQIDLIVGLFSSKHAIKTLHYLKEMTDSLNQAKVSPIQFDWNQAHLERIRYLTTYLRAIGHLSAATTIAALGAETFIAFGMGIRMMLRGGSNNFHKHGANPQELTEAQAKMPPVLLLHGDQHDPTAFEPLLSNLRQKGYQGPVFTAFSPPDDEGMPILFLTESKRQKPIIEEINKIDALYKQHGVLPFKGEAHIRSIMIGHSSGADSAVLLEEQDSTLHIKILLGACKHSERIQSELYTYVDASPDLILNLLPEDKDNKQPNGEVITLPTGHLGLLSHPEMFDICYKKIISEDTQRFFSSGSSSNQVLSPHQKGLEVGCRT